jgi:hypothetical protein
MLTARRSSAVKAARMAGAHSDIEIKIDFVAAL